MRAVSPSPSFSSSSSSSSSCSFYSVPPSPQSKTSSPPSSVSNSYHSSTGTPSRAINMPRPANVDDTAGFMAAARALTQKNLANASSTVKSASGSENGGTKSPRPLSPTAPEFVPSPASSSVAGHHGDTKGTFSPSTKGTGQNVRTSSPTGFNPTVEEFVPSSAASSVSENNAAKKKQTTGEFFMICYTLQGIANRNLFVVNNNVKGTGLDGSTSKSYVADVDDTAKFVAAMRALKSRGTVSATNDHVASSTVEETPKVPGQVDNDIGSMVTGGMEHHQQSPSKDSFTSSTKAEKASSGNGAEIVALSSEDSGRMIGETSFLDEPATPTKKPVKPARLADVDDTAGFMAAARMLRRTPGKPSVSLETFGKLNDNAGDQNTAKDARVGVFTEPVAGVGDAGGFTTAAQALNNAQTSRLSMSPGDHFVSAATSPEKSMNTSKLKTDISVINDNFSAPVAASQQTESSQEKIPSVDDTMGFLAAVRALKERRTSVSATVPEEKKSSGKTRVFLFNGICEVLTLLDDGQPKSGTTKASHIPSATAVENEDRENLITFKSWGAPAPRDKPSKSSNPNWCYGTDASLLASQVRRIVLNGLPSTWATPTKALSLIHDGAIEKISIAPSGNAHIIFCDHEACKAFYDKYPNGIGLGPNNVYVEIVQEVDVISSQLAVNRSVGATRVVRAVGVDLGITMAQFYQIAAGNNRKIEKIVDSYAPDEVSRPFPPCSGLSGLTNPTRLALCTSASAALRTLSVSDPCWFETSTGSLAMSNTERTRKSCLHACFFFFSLFFWY